MRINRNENEDTNMNAVFNKDNMLKASKWLILALFGLVLIVLKVVWAFAWGAFFGKDSKQEDDTPIGTRCWTTKDWESFGDYDKDGVRRW